MKSTEQHIHFPILSQNFKGKFQNSEYEVHQVDPKDSGSHNFSFLALKREVVGVTQILRTATARDGRKIFILSLKSLFIHKKSKNIKICEK
jgi:hypothetical protein